jgi:hypothetical protein
MNRTLERHRNIVDFALSSLLRRKGKNFSLLLVYTLVVFIVASIIFFVQALKREAGLVLSGAPEPRTSWSSAWSPEDTTPYPLPSGRGSPPSAGWAVSLPGSGATITTPP